MFHNLVLSGGGPNGLSYIGCIKYMQEHKIIDQFRNIIGSSIGSIIGLFIAIKLDHKEIEAFIKTTLKLFSNDTKIAIENICNIWSHLGAFDIKTVIGNRIKHLLKLKGFNENISFAELAKITGVNFIVVASNITKKDIEYFGLDDNTTLSVADAICASCTIPLFFKPYIFQEQVYVDAALFCNTPCNYWLEKRNIYSKTLTIEFENRVATEVSPVPKTLLQYIDLIMNNIYIKLNKRIQDDKLTNKTVVLKNYMNTLESILNGIDENIINQQINSGYHSFKDAFTESTSVSTVL